MKKQIVAVLIVLALVAVVMAACAGNQITVTFKVDGEVFATQTVEVGETLTDIPTVPTKTGYTGVWDVTDFSNLTEDIVVNAVYTAFKPLNHKL